MWKEYQLELDSGYIVTVKYEYAPPELEVGYRGGVRIHGIFVALPEAYGDNMVTVDIFNFLVQAELVSREELEEQIEEDITNLNQLANE
jgi:hypothetical protein